MQSEGQQVAAEKIISPEKKIDYLLGKAAVASFQERVKNSEAWKAMDAYTARNMVDWIYASATEHGKLIREKKEKEIGIDHESLVQGEAVDVVTEIKKIAAENQPGSDSRLGITLFNTLSEIYQSPEFLKAKGNVDELAKVDKAKADLLTQAREALRKAIETYEFQTLSKSTALEAGVFYYRLVNGKYEDLRPFLDTGDDTASDTVKEHVRTIFAAYIADLISKGNDGEEKVTNIALGLRNIEDKSYVSPLLSAISKAYNELGKGELKSEYIDALERLFTHVE